MRPGPGHPKHEPMLRELRQIFQAYAVNGRIMFEYKTRLIFSDICVDTVTLCTFVTFVVNAFVNI